MTIPYSHTCACMWSPSGEGDRKAQGSPVATSGSEETPLNPADRSLLQKVIRKGLVENKNELEIQRKDPNSPLYSVRSFDELNLKPPLLKVRRPDICVVH